MIEHSADLDALGAALAKAQAAVKGAKKDSANPFFKSSYADLASVWEACREALTSNGLSVIQFPGFTDGHATITTMLLHSSGQWLQAIAGAPIAKQDAQGVGSALTYLRRYALAAVASVSPEDDDGNAATGRGGKSPVASKGVPARAKPLVAPTPPPTEPLDQIPKTIADAQAEPAPWEIPLEPLKWKSRLLTDFRSDELTTLRELCERKNPVKYAAYLTAIETILTSRGGV